MSLRKRFGKRTKRFLSLTGFTLVELLITLLVIGILSALILPAVSKSRNLAKKATCANNLKQIGVAVGLYLDDFRHFLPQPGNGTTTVTWHKTLNNLYLNDENTFYCPSYTGAKTGFTGNLGSTSGIGYGFNYPLTSWGVGANTHIQHDLIAKRSSCILAADTTSKYMFALPGQVYDRYEDELSTRHNQGANVLFCDFHVKWHLRSAIWGNYPAWWTIDGN